MNMEANKMLAALLVAGIMAYAAGITARSFIHPVTPEQDAYEVAAADDAPAAAGAEAAAGPEPVADLMAAADVAKGEKIAKICSACHTFDKGGANRVGPNLHGIVGKARGGAAGFAYSDAMKGAGGAWTVETLNAFLWNPKKGIPGTKMVFAGLKKPEDRAAMIKWLEMQK